MALWPITLSTLEPKVGETHFILPHAERYLELTDRYDLKLSHFSQPIQEQSFWDKTVIGQRNRLKNIVLSRPLECSGAQRVSMTTKAFNRPPAFQPRMLLMI